MKTKKQSLLLISQEKRISNKLYAVLKQLFIVERASFPDNFNARFTQNDYQLILLIGQRSPADILAKLKELHAIPLAPPIILLSDIIDHKFIVQAYRFGVVDYVHFPLEISELISAIHRQLKKLVGLELAPSEGIFSVFLEKIGNQLFSTEMRLLSPNSDFSNSVAPDNVFFLKVQFLGKFKIQFQNKNIENLFGKRAKSLLAFLLYHHKKPICRDKLIELFWPYSANGAAKNNLNVNIHSIRQIFQRLIPDTTVLKLENDCYVFSPNIIIQTDCEQFTQHYRSAKAISNHVNTHNAIKEYQAGIELYQGDFLENLYEPWVEKCRDHYREFYLFSLNQLSHIFFNEQQFLEAIKYNKLMLEKDNCLEEIHRRLMICYHQLGLSTKVVRQFQKCKKILLEELEMSPSRKTLELLDQLRR